MFCCFANSETLRRRRRELQREQYCLEIITKRMKLYSRAQTITVNEQPVNRKKDNWMAK